MVHTLYGCLSFQECHGKVNNVAVYSLFVASLAKVVRPCMTTYNKLGIISIGTSTSELGTLEAQ